MAMHSPATFHSTAGFHPIPTSAPFVGAALDRKVAGWRAVNSRASAAWLRFRVSLDSIGST